MLRNLILLIAVVLAFPAHGQVRDVIAGRYAPDLDNFILNTDCFANTRNISVTDTGTITRSTASPLRGVASCSIDSTAIADKVIFATRTFDRNVKGRNCEISFEYEGDASGYKYYAVQNSLPASREVQLQDTGSDVKRAKLPFPCGDLSFATTLVVEATAALAPAFKVGNVKVGPLLLSGVAQTKTHAAIWSTVTSSWTGTATSQSSFAVDSDAAATLHGAALEPSTKIPGIRFPAGNYGVRTCTADTTTQSSSGTGGNRVILYAYDGTSTLDLGRHRTRGANSNAEGDINLKWVLPAGTYAETTYQLQYAGETSDGVTLQRAKFTCTEDVIDSEFYSIDSDTSWTGCGLTTADFTGFGTVSSIQDQCKRDGSDLLVRIKFTSGTSTATEARVALKFQGVALTSANSSTIPSIQLAGASARSNPSGTETIWSLIEPSVTYTTFGVQVSTGSALSKVNGNAMVASGATVFYYARIPINSWRADQINATFTDVVTAPGMGEPKDCLYFFGGASATLAAPTECAASPCVEVYDSCAAVTPPTRGTTGSYANLTFSSGTFANSTPVKCECQAFDVTTAATRNCVLTFVTGQESWSSDASGGYSVNASCLDLGGSQQDCYASLICRGIAP